MMKYLEIAIKKDIKEFINYYYDECIKEFNNIIDVIDENLEKMLAIEELQKKIWPYIESILCYQNIYISIITKNIAYLLLLNIKDDPLKLEELEELGDKYLLIAKKMKNLFENEVN